MFNRAKTPLDMDAWVEERLSDYMDGTLSAEDRARMEAHLATSAAARASLESMQWTVGLLRQAPAPKLPRAFTLPVTTPVVSTTPAWLLWGLRGAGVAAALGAFLILGAYLLRPPAAAPSAMQQAPVAANAAPTMLAFAQPTSAPAATNAPLPAPAGGEMDAATPVMQTMPAPQEVIPVTETPDAAARTAATTTVDDGANDAPPPAAPQEPTVEFSTESVAATDTPFPAAAGAAPEIGATDATGAAASQSDVSTQKALILITLEAIVEPESLRVREGPGVQYPAIAGVLRNTRLTVLGRSEDNNWLLIDFPQNVKTSQGWVGASFVMLSGPIADLPIAIPPVVLPTWTPTSTASPTPTSVPPTAIPIDGTGDGNPTSEPTGEATATPSSTFIPTETPTPVGILEPTGEAILTETPDPGRGQ